ncbi:MAG TPA: hypothetical protein VKB84_19940 [Candidatus Binataceae bacterium]|jgi:hypothetical protein|nr:hypothetical protein [Candidatus Binataceae bacterium]
MRIVADFLIVIGAMLLTATLSIIAIAVGHVPADEYPLMVTVVMAAMVGSAMVTAGILVHIRKWQKDWSQPSPG